MVNSLSPEINFDNLNLSDDDIKIINALRRDSNLYEKFLDNPERVIAQISNNFIKSHN